MAWGGGGLYSRSGVRGEKVKAEGVRHEARSYKKGNSLCCLCKCVGLVHS